MIVLLLNTGNRLGDLVTLDRDDVELSELKGILRIIKGNTQATFSLVQFPFVDVMTLAITG